MLKEKFSIVADNVRVNGLRKGTIKGRYESEHFDHYPTEEDVASVAGELFRTNINHKHLKVEKHYTFDV
jgi:hypothetical protein